jgi:hypothetical protein
MVRLMSDAWYGKVSAMAGGKKERNYGTEKED